MFIQIDDLLSPEEVRAVGEVARQSRFVDGRRSNPHNTSKVNEITFIESQIPDPMQRDLLYTLREVRALEGLKMDWRNQIQLEYVIANAPDVVKMTLGAPR